MFGIARTKEVEGRLEFQIRMDGELNIGRNDNGRAQFRSFLQWSSLEINRDFEIEILMAYILGRDCIIGSAFCVEGGLGSIFV